MDVFLRDIKLAKPAPGTLKRAIDVLYGPFRDEARAHNNISSWVAVGQYSIVEQIGRVCHAGMYHVTADRVIYGKFRKNGKPRLRKGQPLATKKDKRKQFRYLVNYTCHCCKPEYWKGQPECNVPFDGQRLRAVMAWYEFLANRSHWARFFVGPKDMFTFLNYGHILDLSAPSFVVHFMSVAWRMPGEYIEQVENWFELVERGIDPHMALGATMNIGGWADGRIEQVASRGHRLMGEVTLECIARFVHGVATVREPASEMLPSNEYYSTSCNHHYAGSTPWHDEGKSKWRAKAEAVYDLCRIVETKSPWGAVTKNRQLDESKFRTVFSPGWRWMMAEIDKFAEAAGWPR